MGDYLFNAHGVGSDANTTTRDFSLTLHVVDFNLTAPAPGSLTVNPSSVSGPTAFDVTASGTFNQEVTLSCSGLPAGAACSFDSTLRVSVFRQPGDRDPDHKHGCRHAPGNIPNFHQRLGRWRTDPDPDPVADCQHRKHQQSRFRLAVSNPSLTANPNEAVVFNGTLTASDGYGSAVNLRCSGAVPLTCTPSPAHPRPVHRGRAHLP